MADNTVLNSGTGGDTIRSVAKTATSAKTQAVLIDIGGGTDASPEAILAAGQALMAASLPVTIASNQSSVPVSGTVTANISGSISNTGFAISGTLPAFAATPTVNIGTAPTITSGAVYNSTPPTLTTGQSATLQADSSGNLKVNVVTGGGSGSNAAAGATGSAVPASAGYTGFNSGGNLVGVSSANPLPVSGSFYQATQPVSLAALPALATGANAIGSITNTAFGISGTLPAFAATPTVNIGTAPAIALAAGSAAIGSITNTSFAVTGTFWQATQPISAASLPLPAGAATAANQTAPQSSPGVSAATALTIQGSAAGVPLPVQQPQSAPTVLTTGTAHDYTAYGALRVQVDSLSGGDSISFAGSVASGGATYALEVLSLSGTYGTTTATITANGIFLVLGGAGLFVTPTHTGVASTPVITASASQ